jgi:hypothetical protein
MSCEQAFRRSFPYCPIRWRSGRPKAGIQEAGKAAKATARTIPRPENARTGNSRLGGGHPWHPDADWPGLRRRNLPDSQERRLSNLGEAGARGSSRPLYHCGDLELPHLPDHLYFTKMPTTGRQNGRSNVEGRAPRWMRFPPSAYTACGEIGCVGHHVEIASLG